MTDPERPRLTFFFPAYNEEENIAETIRRALDEVGPLVGGSIEVLAVDDANGITIRPDGGEERVVPFDEIVRCKLVVEDPFAAASMRKGRA